MLTVFSQIRHFEMVFYIGLAIPFLVEQKKISVIPTPFALEQKAARVVACLVGHGTKDRIKLFCSAWFGLENSQNGHFLITHIIPPVVDLVLKMGWRRFLPFPPLQLRLL